MPTPRQPAPVRQAAIARPPDPASSTRPKGTRLLGWLAAVVWAAALSLPANAGTDQSLFDFRLGDLRSGEIRSLEGYRGTPSFLVFFEPGCPWCVKQMRALEELGAACPGRIQTLTAGVHGNLPEYRRLIRVAGTEHPAFVASDRLVAAIGGVPATPYTLFLDRKGRPTHRLRGLVPAPELRTWLAEQGIRCPSEPEG
jgi:hypothetical protein